MFLNQQMGIINSLTAKLSYILITSHQQAMENECWLKAVETELLALDEAQT